MNHRLRRDHSIGERPGVSTIPLNQQFSRSPLTVFINHLI